MMHSAAIMSSDATASLLAIVWGAALLLTIGFAVTLVVAFVQGRAWRQAGRRVLVYLESAVRLGAPLPEMMEAAAASEGRRLGSRLWAFARQLRDGRTLRDALAICVPEVSARHRELIGAAERTGRLGEGLAALLEREQREDRALARSVDWIYPFVVMIVMVALVMGMAVFIWPKFQEIYADFDTALPSISTRVFGDEGMLGFVMGSALLAVVTGAGLLVFFIIAFHRWAGLPVPMLLLHAGEAVSLLAGRLPIVGPAMRDRQYADAFYVVGSAVRSSMALDAALMEAQTLRLDPVLRSRLGRWASGLHGGGSPDASARRAGMPRLVCGMLATGQAAASPAEAFDFLHRYYALRFSRALELIRGAVVPVSVLGLGALAALLVLAMFAPLVALIRSTLEAM